MSEFNRVGGDAEAMKTAGQEMFLQIKRKSRNEAVVEGRFWAREVCFVLNGNYYMYVLVGKKNKAYNSRVEKRDHCWRRVLTGTDQRGETLMPRHLILGVALEAETVHHYLGK